MNELTEEKDPHENVEREQRNINFTINDTCVDYERTDENELGNFLCIYEEHKNHCARKVEQI